jgi:hypothetical protein
MRSITRVRIATPGKRNLIHLSRSKRQTPLCSLALLLALKAQGGVRKSLQTSTIYPIAAVLAQPIGASITLRQGIVHLAQETLQILTQCMILGVFEHLGSIIGDVGAVARIILLYHT